MKMHLHDCCICQTAVSTSDTAHRSSVRLLWCISLCQILVAEGKGTWTYFTLPFTQPVRCPNLEAELNTCHNSPYKFLLSIQSALSNLSFDITFFFVIILTGSAGSMHGNYQLLTHALWAGSGSHAMSSLSCRPEILAQQEHPLAWAVSCSGRYSRVRPCWARATWPD